MPRPSSRLLLSLACTALASALGGCIFPGEFDIDPNGIQTDTGDTAEPDTTGDTTDTLEPPDTADTDPGDLDAEDLAPQCEPHELACAGACVDPLRDGAHCGACGVACGSEAACHLGGCVGLPVVAVGGEHACVLGTDGRIGCWGRNDAGQLGQPPDSAATTVAVEVAWAADDEAPCTGLVAGAASSCALQADGEVYCWGSDARGELGNGSDGATHVPRPVLLSDGSPLRARSLAASHGARETQTVCAITAQAELYCWGDNSGGKLAPSGSGELFVAPQRVDLALAVHGVAIGARHLCVRGSADATATASDTVQCRGADDAGQLGGDGLGLLSDQVSALVAGDAHTCAIANGNQSVYCWGSDTHCQLGRDEACDPTAPSPGPVLVDPATLDGASWLAAAGDATCAVRGAVSSCWGHNATGALGSGRRADEPRPVAVSGVSNVDAVAMGGATTCALGAGGVACAGANTFGQLGDGTVSRAAPSPALRPALTIDFAGADPRHLASTDDAVCAVVEVAGGLHEVRCWGNGESGQLGALPAASPGAQSAVPLRIAGVDASGRGAGPAQLDGGARHVCLDVPDPSASWLWCWGENGAGQALPSSPDAILAPTRLDPAPGALPLTRVGAGQAHTCVVSAPSQAVSCFGAGSSGAMGFAPGSTTVVDSPGPHPLHDGDAAVRGSFVAAGHGATCVADYGSATLTCLGDNRAVVMGEPEATGPGVHAVALEGAIGARALALGERHGCVVVALSDADEIRCWGDDTLGQLGHGTDTPDGLRAIDLSAVPGAPLPGALDTGLAHTCVALGERLACWGDNRALQLGTEVAGVDAVTLDLTGGRSILDVSAGATHTCLLLADAPDNEVLCWGTSTHGQLGPGVGQDRSWFAPVSALAP